MTGFLQLIVGAVVVACWYWLLVDYWRSNQPEKVLVEQKPTVRVIPAPYDWEERS